MVRITVLHNELEKFDNDLSGVSLLIETGKLKILFDVSFKDDIIINSKKAGISLDDIDYLVLSHGHIDHTEGLKHLDFSGIKSIVCHPKCFEKKYYQGKIDIGSPVALEEIRNKTKVILSSEPYWFENNRVVFLGEIPRINDFEGKHAVGNLENGDRDFVIDDSALAIKSEKGLIIISGCSHSGICNIIDYAKKTCNEEKIYSVIGGFHLFNKEHADKTIEFFGKLSIEKLYPMHCLNEYAFSEFKKIGGIRLKTLEEIRV
ncbi:MAG: MBL fold metallo-hydrolase [Nanoarchaeota archaeon]|nr:MBL fold metallo-hydrolase [Nanoarchaeota archaeon]